MVQNFDFAMPGSKPSPSPSPSRLSRVTGALLALHAGDSLGASVEFEPHKQIAARYPTGLREIIGGGPFSWSAGHATDDTDMTRGVLLAYWDLICGGGHSKIDNSSYDNSDQSNKAEQDGGKSKNDVATLAGEYFLKWRWGDWPGRRIGSAPIDMGGATGVGLDVFAQTKDPDRSGAGHGSAGNGSLMRCLPTGLFQLDPHKLMVESMRISAITHNDRRCTVSCAVYNRIVAALTRGTCPDGAVQAGEAVARRLEEEAKARDGDSSSLGVVEAIRLGRRVEISSMAKHGPPAEMKGHCSGYVLETLSVAIAAVLDEERSLEDVLVDVVRIGRDTDTNAAVAGGLLGARDGEDAIPRRWREKLQFGKEFRELARQIVERQK